MSPFGSWDHFLPAAADLGNLGESHASDHATPRFVTKPQMSGNYVIATSPTEIPFIRPNPPSDQPFWPVLVNDNIPPSSASTNLEPLINRRKPPNPEIVLQVRGAQGGPGPGPGPYGLQKRPSNEDSEGCPTGAGLVVPSYNVRGSYPSPHSEMSPSGGSPHRSNRRDTLVGPDGAPSSIEGSLSPARSKSTGAADNEANEKAVFRCLHKDCASEPPQFTRRCEYK